MFLAGIFQAFCVNFPLLLVSFFRHFVCIFLLLAIILAVILLVFSSVPCWHFGRHFGFLWRCFHIHFCECFKRHFCKHFCRHFADKFCQCKRISRLNRMCYGCENKALKVIWPKHQILKKKVFIVLDQCEYLCSTLAYINQGFWCNYDKLSC